jgi:hypothetical protein
MKWVGESSLGLNVVYHLSSGEWCGGRYWLMVLLRQSTLTTPPTESLCQKVHLGLWLYLEIFKTTINQQFCSESPQSSLSLTRSLSTAIIQNIINVLFVWLYANICSLKHERLDQGPELQINWLSTFHFERNITLIEK